MSYNIGVGGIHSMAVDSFNVDEFKVALNAATDPHDLLVVSDGLVRGEYHFSIPVREVKGHEIVIEVNSSVGANGESAGAGDDSIRAWLTANDQPLGNKVQRWVTRVPGWETRLATVIDTLVKISNSLDFCETCQELERVYKVKKPGANKGRLFRRCRCSDSFRWLELDEKPAPKAAEGTPACPQCGGAMKLRSGKYGDFFGCVKFPRCRGTVDVKDAGKPQPQPEVGKVEEGGDPNAVTNRFPPSEYQKAIFSWVEDGYNGTAWDIGKGKNLVVEAVAGSGKTTTGVQMLERVPRDKAVLFVAFNKHIASELKKRAPSHVTATTLHSLGFSALRAAFNLKRDDVRKDKVKILLGRYFDIQENGHLVSPITKLVSLVKANLTSTDPEALLALADHYGIELNGDLELLFGAVQYIIETGRQQTNVIDFDDMCYLPVALGIACKKYDFIFVDEAQDLNKVQLELLKLHIGPDTRFVAVGDRYQSLYGFRGADVDSIPNIIDTFHADTLPLSLTYRNPKSVVQFVNEKFPHIPLECPDTAKEGSIISLPQSLALDKMVTGDMVLCRTNAPLVGPCFKLIRQGTKATIRGRDIGEGLVSLAKKMKAADLYELMIKLSEYKYTETAKLLMAKKNSRASALADKVETLIALADGLSGDSPVQAVIDRINDVFSDATEGVVFSSVHKAKGLQAQTVYILRPELMPHPMAEADWELEQERNVEYVALTRTKETLVFVSS